MKTSITIVPEERFDKMGTTWQSCEEVGGTILPDHNRMIEKYHHCMRCGEASEVTLRRGDRLSLYIKDGELIRIDVGTITNILNYNKVRQLK